MAGSIAVLAPGGVGGFVAGALARAGDGEIWVVAREPTARVIARDGLQVHSRALGDFTVHPAVVSRLEHPVDVLLVAPKATALSEALARIDAQPWLVVPLLNGIEHLAVLRDRFGAGHVAAGVIRSEADRPRPGVIDQLAPIARIDLATDQPALAPALAALDHRLTAAGITVRIGASETEVMWSKLARLCPLALTTSASDRPIGFVRSDPRWRSALENAIAETAAAGNAEGARLDPEATLAELDGAPAQLGSSMQRDLAAGREPELDAIAGAVLRTAARHRLPTPTLRWLTDRVAARAATHTLGQNA